MHKKIKFFIKNIIRIALIFIVSVITFRNKKILIMGLKTPKTKFIKESKDYFMHNTKYLFLKLSKTCKNFKIIYLIDDYDMRNRLKDKGYSNIYSRKSLMGIYYALRAKYWIYNDAKIDITNSVLSGGAVCINTWHGIPLKKIGFDSNLGFQKRNNILKQIELLLYDKNNYLIANNDYDANVFKTAFLSDSEHTPVLCSPRLDILFNDIENAEIFMEDDFFKIKSFKSNGKKIFIYMPTFRDTGKDISGWLKSDKIKRFLKDNNAVLVCKLHFADKNILDSEESEEIYKINSNSDIYPVLKYSDALITDYSSVYFDYLLLNKPIIYYPIDLEEYQEKCRGLYGSYEELTAGIKTYNEDSLIDAMKDVINGIDNYTEQRKRLRDKMFKYQDGMNCERVAEWIKSLDK